jgi:predicted nucleic acid-binding protein
MKLLDTNTLIERLKEQRYEPNAISIITLIEVLRGLDDKKRGLVKQLLEESFEVKGLDNETIQTYCRVYQKLKKKATPLPDADLLIAATAITNNLPLVTRDEHFKYLREFGLELEEA